jgi:hypothetical protein
VPIGRGKVARNPRILSVRALEKADLAVLTEERRVVTRVKAFRSSHHRLARLVASGMKDEDICRILGCSYQNLWLKKQDPAFMELVTGYRNRIDDQAITEASEVQDKAAEIIIRNLDQMEQHLDRSDESGELIPLATLVKINADLMNRFGYPAKTMNTNVNVDIGQFMKGTMRRSGRSSVIDAPKLVEATTLPGPEQSEASTNVPAGGSSAPAEVPVTVAGFRRRG